MNILRILAAACAFALLAPAPAEAAGAIGAAALRARHTSLAPQLSNNAFGGPLVLQSEENARRIDGEVFAVLEHPFPAVAAALGDAGKWCEILILHLNTKYCRQADSQGTMRLDMRVGKKVLQSPDSASKILFTWKPAVQREDYLLVQMEAPDGPYDTHEYRLLVEAVPLDAGHTFLHMGYALSYGATSDFAMGLYLGTVARDKVGFTRVKDAKPGEEPFVSGSRGIVERNTMRYYLAIDAYLDSLKMPAAQQLESRLQAWFDATEKYPRQLHEVERDPYLQMKRVEVQRQTATR
jgi:hypothetical protein